MRAKMLVDAVVREADSDRSFVAGQEIEGADAELQVGLGHAEAIAGSEDVVEDAAEVSATQGALDHAKAEGVDISTIKGTGKDGKVTKADVEAAIAAKEAS